MKNLDAWVRKEIKAMEKMDAKIDKQLDRLEVLVGIKKKRKPRNNKARMAKACADRLIAQAIADGKITLID